MKRYQGDRPVGYKLIIIKDIHGNIDENYEKEASGPR